jgi:hypothetical protein
MTARDNDANHLHPLFRARDLELWRAVQAARMPIRPFEGWRDPFRQAFLYCEGRVPGIGTPGHHVTFETAWGSRHPYGFARDWVWLIEGAWSWTPPPGYTWEKFGSLVKAAGLERLAFEQPHVQLPGIDTHGILAGTVPWPAGGDTPWEANLEAAIVAWGRAPRTVNGIVMPGAPPLPSGRPAGFFVGVDPAADPNAPPSPAPAA